MQVAAFTVYWEYTRSSEASEKKKQAEQQLTEQLRAEAASQREVRCASLLAVMTHGHYMFDN
jgi:hypothetical protein